MILLHGNLQPYVEPFFSALKTVSWHDPLRTEFNGDPYQHRDGWGYLSLSRDSEIYARFPGPVYDAGELHQASGLLLVHSRRASKGESHGVDFSHPFHLFDDKHDYFLIHSGQFDKKAIMRFMDLEPEDPMSDSQAFLRLVVASEGKPKQKMTTALRIIRELNAIKTTSNVMLVAKERFSSSADCLIYTDSGLEKDYKQHSWLYALESKGFKAFVSSSVAETEVVKSLEQLKMTRLPKGEIATMSAGNLRGTNLL